RAPRSYPGRTGAAADAASRSDRRGRARQADPTQRRAGATLGYSVAMPGALDGVRIADFSRVLAGPYATMLLGDLGAEVWKVERPGFGDETRAWGPPFVGRQSAYYLSVNRNKRSAALDFTRPEDLEAVKRAARAADVVVEN